MAKKKHNSFGTRWGEGYTRQCIRCNVVFIYRTPQGLGMAWSNHVSGNKGGDFGSGPYDKPYARHYDPDLRTPEKTRVVGNGYIYNEYRKK